MGHGVGIHVKREGGGGLPKSRIDTVATNGSYTMSNSGTHV